jgi:hypothetical protein
MHVLSAQLVGQCLWQMPDWVVWLIALIGPALLTAVLLRGSPSRSARPRLPWPLDPRDSKNGERPHCASVSHWNGRPLNTPKSAHKSLLANVWRCTAAVAIGCTRMRAAASGRSVMDPTAGGFRRHRPQGLMVPNPKGGGTCRERGKRRTTALQARSPRSARSSAHVSTKTSERGSARSYANPKWFPVTDSHPSVSLPAA